MVNYGSRTARTTCAIVGGGPAGLITGLLLARRGVEVTVLEKHSDFLRDFRGDTVHPSTLQALDDLGLFAQFDALPHSRITSLTLPLSTTESVTVVDFSRLRVDHPYIAMVPQWDLLDLLASTAQEEPNFRLLVDHEVTDVLHHSDRVSGVEYISPHGPGRLAADLVIACDGRWSVVRRALNIPIKECPVPFDVWWFRIPTKRRIGETLLPRVKNGKALIAIPRQGYVQAAFLGPKGTDALLRAEGLESFRTVIAGLVPELADDIASVESMDDIKHLDVHLNRLLRWWVPGALCIGDAAHAMSPAGGVGVNLAIQDGIAAARLLGDLLLDGENTDKTLAEVQRRRTMPTVVIQIVQRFFHRTIISRGLAGRNDVIAPQAMRFIARFPWLSGIPARLIGIGPRPEAIPRWARRPAPTTRARGHRADHRSEYQQSRPAPATR